jgi:hypothetical protein
VRIVRILGIGGLVVAVIAMVWLLFIGLPRWYAPRPKPPVATARPAPAVAAPGRKIKARLFYVSDDGTRLKGVERDVPYGDGAAAQAQEIVKAQIEAAAPPLVSAVPPGTTLRALYLTSNGSAFVDLSASRRLAR